MTYSKVIVGCLAICAVFWALVIEALFGAIGFPSVAWTIVRVWITVSAALWMVAGLWLWRTGVLQRRELDVEFPRARARRAR